MNETMPRVLHLNDCAFGARNIVLAAARAGISWELMGAETLKYGPTSTLSGRMDFERLRWQLMSRVRSAHIVHVHFASTPRLLQVRLVPHRPYVLHLHGTDIRSHWTHPRIHDQVQLMIDGASHAYYSTPDLEQLAMRARKDAEYFPTLIDPDELPPWRPNSDRPYIAFASRWDVGKGAHEMLETAACLKRTLRSARVVGLDWGDQADAARALGVELLPRLSHPEYLGFLAGAAVVVGQSNSVLGVSELEALGIGVPLAAGGIHLPGPDGRPLPIQDGNPSAIAAWVRAAFNDPIAASRTQAGREWALRLHTADRLIPQLVSTYSSIAQRPGGRA